MPVATLPVPHTSSLRGAYLSTGAILPFDCRRFSAFYRTDRGRCLGINHWIFLTNSFNLVSVFMFITTFISIYTPCSKGVKRQKRKKKKKIKCYYCSRCTSRSQWPRGLRHGKFSLARTLGSWVRISLKTWMSVCVCVVLCVGNDLSTGCSPIQGVLLTVYRIKNLNKRPNSNYKNCRDVDRQ
jgi:hypothetical protein